MRILVFVQGTAIVHPAASGARPAGQPISPGDPAQLATTAPPGTGHR